MTGSIFRALTGALCFVALFVSGAFAETALVKGTITISRRRRHAGDSFGGDAGAQD